MGIPLLSDEMQLRSVTFQTLHKYMRGVGKYMRGGGGYSDYCGSEATLFMRTYWFIAYNIQLESLLSAMQELLCFSHICRSRRLADRQT